MRKNILLAVFSVISIFVYSQETDLKKIKLIEPILNTDSIMQVGIKFHDSEKYTEAIAEYEKINENDSNYVLAQLELANTYSALKKDSVALKICNAIITDSPSSIIEKMLLQAKSYEGLKDFQKAESIYNEGIKKFPLSPRFYHELAISYFKQKKYKETQANFIKALEVNPNYAPTHFQLGFFALKEKKIIPAMLAFQYYLLLDNYSQRAQNVVNYLEQIGDDAVKYEDMELFEPIDQNDDFSDLESIVRSKAAYSDKFKSKVGVNFRVLKQIQVVLDKLEFNAEDKGFYNQYYAKYFKELVSKNFTETYLYYILSEMKIEDVNKWVKNNKSDVEKFGKWHGAYLKSNRYATKSNVDGKDIDAFKYYNSNELVGIGNYDENNNPSGYWKFYFSKTGVLKSEGNYNSKFEREGKWKYYYPNGIVKENCNFKNDKLDGEYFKYAYNGKPLQKLMYKEGKYDGLQTLYHINGSIKNTYSYVNGLISGEETEYHTNGKIKYKALLTDEKLSGEVVVYYDNGSVQKKINFVKGNQTGKAVEFHKYPKDVVSGEGNYENNTPVGEWKYYYETGKISSIGTLNKKGQKEGVWKEYDTKGNLISEDSYSDGKYEGPSKNYYANGKVYEEYVYRRGKINAYKYFDKNGTLVKEFIKQKKDFSFELYNKNGTLRKSGKLVDDVFDGLINSYDFVGVKTETTEYKDEKRVNKEYTYFSNGKVHDETPLVDGKVHGLFNEYFVNGKILTQGYMVNGVAQGYWFYYDRMGLLNDIKYFVDGEQYGWQRNFACNGKVFKAEFFNQGYILKRCYFDTLGNITQRLNYDSTAAFTFTVPNFDGNVAYKRPIQNNYLNGTSINYYPNGKTHTERTFVMDQENGNSKYFDVYGNLSKDENYDYDKLNGKYATYDNKALEYTATYLNNQLMGEAIDYFYNGKPYVKTSYEYDKAMGPQTYYDLNGNVGFVRNYDSDNFESYTYEGENGQLVAPIEINKPNMDIKSFYKNKKAGMTFSLKNGDREGLLVFYDANGAKVTEENYSEGYLNGPRTTYYPSGKVKSKATFYFGKFDGLYTEYYENGNKKEELTFLNGSRHGNSTYYDINGKQTVKYFYYDDSAYKIVK
mgnify:CR=1 FL=1